MLKNRNFWLKVFVVSALSFSSISAYGGAPGPRFSALGDLLTNPTVSNLVELPAPAEVAAPERAVSTSGAPKPGKDFSPRIEDGARIKAITKLLADINNGVNLPYSQDGAIFSNKEGRLPVQPKGYYHEYTLLTGSAPHTVTIGGQTYQVAPDLSARGSERVIIGGGEKIYYTPDHYANFILLTVVY